jgi:uncharacterized protein with HEPN domain
MKDDRLYLIHISECIQRIEKYLRDGGRDAFMASDLMQDAIIRNLQTNNGRIDHADFRGITRKAPRS